MRIAHIINPVKVGENSDLFIAQPVTFESMRRAKAAYHKDLEVNLYTAQYPEDRSIIPDYFLLTEDLHKSTLDYPELPKFKKLPFIKDILDNLYENSQDADYLIYTNVDIGVQEHFYKSVISIIKKFNLDAFVINRITIPKELNSVDQLPEMYNHPGEKHPGYDCFIFKRDLYPEFHLGNACIGANWIGRVLISNLIAHANSFKIFEDEKLTFHIGDDRSWKKTENTAFDELNNNELHNFLSGFRNIDDKPYLNLLLEKAENIKRAKTNSPLILEKRKQLSCHSFFDKSPVFLVGFPRSGTTYLQSLITTQGIVSFPETHFFAGISLKSNSVNSNYLEDFQIKSICNQIEKKMSFKISEDTSKKIDDIRSKKCVDKKALFELIIIDYLTNKGVDYYESQLLEKTPYHFAYLEIIAQWYPESKFIAIVRNPIHSISSFYKNLVEYRKPYKQLAKEWIRSIKAIENFTNKNGKKIHVIKYEDLTNNTEEEMAEVCQFLNIPFFPSRLNDFHLKAKDIIADSEPWKRPNTSSEYVMNKNTPKIPFKDLLQIQSILKYYLKMYDYPYYYPKHMLVFNIFQSIFIKLKNIKYKSY